MATIMTSSFVAKIEQALADQRDLAELMEAQTALLEDLLAQVREHRVDEAPQIEAMPQGRMLTPGVPNSQRVRDAPFRRIPRSESREWVLSLLTGEFANQWVSPIQIARFYANGNEAKERYLRGMVARELRDLWAEGKLWRRDFAEPGSRYQYRLPVDDNV